MKKLACLLVILMVPGLAGAVDEDFGLMDVRTDLSDKASLQRGAKYFVNYCLGCHSLKYLRYQRLGQDLDLPDELVEKYLIWDDSKISSPMTNAMRPKDADNWLGGVPMDLTLAIRRHSGGGLRIGRGADWVYTYLNTFYRDDKTPTGVNNLVIPNASMPHVLWRLQGVPEPVYALAEGDRSAKQRKVIGVKMPEGGGALSQAEYQQMTRDIVNFLVYASEPIQSARKALGLPVLLFLVVFLAIIYLLKQEYWKDVH